MFYGIQSRFRLYTTKSDYLSIFIDLLFRRHHRGNACNRFEEKLSTYLKSNHTILVPQARVGIYLALKALIKPGQKVILSCYTISDVINMVICAGGIPLFADIDSQSCNIDLGEIRKLMDSNTAAIIITHLYGKSCQIEEIVELCKRFDVPLIEDCAQALGSRYNGQLLGTFGDVGIFSFGKFKNLTSFFGGAIITKNGDLESKIIAQLQKLPFMRTNILLKKVWSALLTDIATSRYLFSFITFPLFKAANRLNIRIINKFVANEINHIFKNTIPQSYLCRLMPLQARLLIRKLAAVDNDIKSRIRTARIYYKKLSKIKELQLTPPIVDGSHTYSYYPISYKDRATLMKWLMDKNRDIGAGHIKNCADLEIFSQYYRNCPNARAVSNQLILLPTYPNYCTREVLKNVAAIKAFFHNQQP